MGLHADTRAQSIAFLQAGATLVLFAALYAVMQEPVSVMFDASSTVTTTQQAATGRSYIQRMWTWLPLAAMGLITLMLIARAVAASGRP